MPTLPNKSQNQGKRPPVHGPSGIFLKTIIGLGMLLVIGILVGYGSKSITRHKTIGIICLNSKILSIVDGFKERLAELGHTEGKNITYLSECPLKDRGQVKDAIDSLISRKVDLLFTMSTPITKQALKATEGTNIPIVFTPVYNAVESGIVDNLRNHDKNLTGVQVGGSTPKTLEWLLTISPQVKELLVPINEADPAARFGLKDLKAAADKLGVRLLISKISSTEELTTLLDRPPEETDAIWVLHGNYMVPRLPLFIKAATHYKVPLASATGQYKQGVMISYGQRYKRTGRQVARLAHKILQGISPKDLPIETTDFFLGLNLKTAQAAGISISDDTLRHAEDIVH